MTMRVSFQRDFAKNKTWVWGRPASKSRKPSGRWAVGPFVGFTVVVDAGPEELGGDEGVIGDGLPGAKIHAVLAAEEDAVGHGGMVGGIAGFLVIVADDVEVLVPGVRGNAGQAGRV